MSNSQKAGAIFGLIIQVLFIIATFVLNLLIIIKVKFEYKYAEILGNNNSQSPLFIKGITVKEATEECELGQTKIVFGKWNGLVEGCNTTSGVTKGGCSGQGSSISETSAQDIKIFANKKFCYSGIRNYHSMTVARDCGTKLKCGIIDTNGNYLCMENDGSEVCPINYMKISNTKPTECDALSCSEIDLGNTYKIYMSNQNKDTGYIVSHLTVGDDIPCADPDYQVSKSGYPIEKNVVGDKTACPKISSKDYAEDKRIDGTKHLIGEFPRSFIFSSDISTPPQYPVDKTIKMYVYPYIGYNPDSPKYKRQIVNNSRFEEYKRNCKTFRKYALVAFVFNCIALPYSLIMTIAKACKNEGEQEEKGCFDFLMGICSLLLLIFIIVSFVYSCYALQKTDGYDEITKNILNIEYDKVYLGWLFLLILVILNFIGLILTLLITFCVCCFGCCACCIAACLGS